MGFLLWVYSFYRKGYFYKLPFSEQTEIFVLGNGPSVKDVLVKNPNAFKSKEVFCVNNIAEMNVFKKIKPRYYILVDPGFFAIDISNEKKIKRDRLIESFSKIDWDMFLFLPRTERNSPIIREYQKNTYIKIIYFNNFVYSGFEKIKFFLWKNNLSSPVCMNVLHAALFLSINMKYKKIYLLGAENSWFKNYEAGEYNNQNCIYEVNNSYCYDKENVENENTRKIVYKDHLELEPIKISYLMECFYINFREHEIISKYAFERKTSIFNITPNSFIDAYEKRLKCDIFNEN